MPKVRIAKKDEDLDRWDFDPKLSGSLLETEIKPYGSVVVSLTGVIGEIGHKSVAIYRKWVSKDIKATPYKSGVLVEIDEDCWTVHFSWNELIAAYEWYDEGGMVETAEAMERAARKLRRLAAEKIAADGENAADG